MMGYSVFIQKNSTGEVREYKCDFEWTDNSTFMWTEGNFSCDCNLSLFFLEVGGQEDDENQLCGNKDFKITKIISDSGEKLL